MDEKDRKIIELFHSRSEDAIAEMESRYARLALSTAKNILSSREDAEECVSDALGVLWEKIPPENP